MFLNFAFGFSIEINVLSSYLLVSMLFFLCPRGKCFRRERLLRMFVCYSLINAQCRSILELAKHWFSLERCFRRERSNGRGGVKVQLMLCC